MDEASSIAPQCLHVRRDNCEQRLEVLKALVKPPDDLALLLGDAFIGGPLVFRGDSAAQHFAIPRHRRERIIYILKPGRDFGPPSFTSSTWENSSVRRCSPSVRHVISADRKAVIAST